MKRTIQPLLLLILSLIFQLSGLFLNGQGFKGDNSRSHTVQLVKDQDSSKETDSTVTITFLARVPYLEADNETKAAFDFLKSIRNISGNYIVFSELKKHPKILRNVSLVWFHRPDTADFHEDEMDPKVLNILKEYLTTGGRLFLSLSSMKYLVPLGIETEIPQDSIKSSMDNGYGRKLGFHAFLDHPIFSGMNGGAYIWKPYKDLNTHVSGYFGDKKPKNGKVIAVDWDYIFIREDSKIVMEYDFGKGKIIAVGAYTWYSQPNFNREHLELFTKNAFHYLISGNGEMNCHFWDYEPNHVLDCPEEPKTDQFLLAVPESIPWPDNEEPMTLSSRFATSNYWDVAGERMVTMGKETGGIEEVWAHPFMALRDYEVGIRFEYSDTIYWLQDERPQIEVRPGSFKRTYQFARAFLIETTVNDPVDPSGVIHYEYKGVYGATLIVRFKSNLRLMWPYSEKVTGAICHGWNSDLNAFVIRDKSGNMVTMIGANRNPLEAFSGQFSGFSYDRKVQKFFGIPSGELRVAGLAVYALKMNDRIDMVFTATNEGLQQTKYYFNKAIQNPLAIINKSDSTCADQISNSLMITTPEQNFNLGYRWTLLAADRFYVNTPGMGKSLVAGYSTTNRGWDGGQKVSGRPGYAWYFGRDGQWSGMALLDEGDFGKVRSILGFYQKYQDLSGKILHEATTSGVIHYDAADATPLYIVLAGKYFRHTNDTTFLKQSWPFIKKAVDFCFSTDSDHDHLIENTNVGHGWVETGELYGSHATLYLNACWAEALQETFTMAKALHQPEAENYKLESQTIRKIINSDFWNKGMNFYSYGKNKDGSFRPEPTILPAVPLGFKLADRAKAPAVLTQYASNTFTTNWGTRIIRDDSPLFNPNGYHYGSVWPLFTGWASMAEYAYGNYQQGFSHIMNNLNVYQHWGKGFVEEVLNGDEYLPSGVCAHQCWSETMVLQPAIEGMLGLVVNAQDNKVTLAPHLPADWDSLKVENIRVGDQLFDFKLLRTEKKYIYQFVPKKITQLEIEFLPSCPAGTIFENVLLNGEQGSVASFKTSQYTSLLMEFKFSSLITIEIDYTKGISVLPLIQDPKPGYPAAGLRILSTNFSGNQYTIDLESPAGSSDTISVYLNGQQIDKIENGMFLSQTGNIVSIGCNFEKDRAKYVKKSVVVSLK
jgi:glycogen debranching enzyme